MNIDKNEEEEDLSKRIPWKDDEIQTKKKANKKNKILMPHPGQSYNPDDGHHQLALKEAVEREKIVFKSAKNINDFLTMGEEEAKKEGGDDVLDGIKAQEQEESTEEDVELPEKKTPKKKLPPTKKKKKNILKAKYESKKRQKEKENQKETIKQIERYAKEIDEKIKGRKRTNTEEPPKKKRKVERIITGARDVLLTDELPDALRKVNGTDHSLWRDKLKLLHDKKVIKVKRMNEAYIDGIWVKENELTKKIK